MGMPRGMREAITADRLDRIKEKNRQKDAAREAQKSSGGGSKNDHARHAGKEYTGNRDGGRKR